MLQYQDIQIKVLDPRVRNLPEYQSVGAAGLDLCTLETITVQPNDVALVTTGIAVHIDNECLAGFVYPRSSFGPMRLSNTTGVIDSDYQGEVMIKLYNPTPYARMYDAYERIAQIVFMPIVRVNWNVVDEFENTTARNSGGFGHTGRI